MIYREHRCIFVHIPKTGGTSITKALGDIDPTIRGSQDHRPIRQFRSDVSEDEFRSFFKFTFVRNPWARVASWYRNVIRDPEHRREFRISEQCTFREFLVDYGHIWGLQPQLHWILDDDGTIPLDFVGRFEHLEDDFAVVCNRLGISSGRLPHLVRGNDARPYTVLYDDETRDIVANRYAEEIAAFGYEFVPSKARRTTPDPLKPPSFELQTGDTALALLAQALLRDRPAWVLHSLGPVATEFLLKAAFRSPADATVEIGSGSGFSAVVLCHAMRLASEAGGVDAEFRIASYDSALTCGFDQSREIGAAAREQLPPQMLRHITFRPRVTATDLGYHHAPESIGLLLIDGDHRHPWPTLDLLAALPYLSPGATVILNAINLPEVAPQHAQWGAKHLFDALILSKVTAPPPTANIGSFLLPANRTAFEAQLRQVLLAHPWEATINDAYLRRLGLT